MLRSLIAAALLCAAALPAHAQHPGDPRDIYTTRQPEVARSIVRSIGRHGSKVIGSRPRGCPARYCGCASAMYLGIPNPGGRLNLAANWLRFFPRATPAPRMAAARRGHVFVILQVLGGNRVLAYDPNSGGRKTRIHERSLAGFTVVNPNTRFASLR